MVKKTDVNQWKNTSNVINWFNNNKKDCSVIQFDIKESRRYFFCFILFFSKTNYIKKQRQIQSI